MFKVGELRNTCNEKIHISTQDINYCEDKNNKKYKSLIFEISGKLDDNEFSIYIELNNDMNDFLNYKKLEKYNINKYICESYLCINEVSSSHTNFDLNIIRYLKNKFNITLSFFTETMDNSFEEKYSGLIEFDFNLDDYLGVQYEIN